MSSISFYLILIAIFTITSVLYLYQRNKPQNRHIARKLEPILKNNININNINNNLDKIEPIKSPYASDVIALQIQAFPDKPYMGYELLQTLLASKMQFGKMNIFHRIEKENEKNEKEGEASNVLFSMASATKDGTFPIDSMGGFKCMGLIAFMRMDAKQKLMSRFDLMLDISRQIADELGGEIYDDLGQAINASAIRRLREKICTVETSNLYAADLLDNLD